MDNTRIEEALTRLFDEEGHRIVFCNDPDRGGEGDVYKFKSCYL